MKVVITDHAADRFCLRVDRTKTNHEAIAILTAAAPNATILEKRSIRGDELRAIDSPSCVLICKHENSEIIVVTVLAQAEELTPEADAVIEAFKVRHLSKVTNLTLVAVKSRSKPKTEAEMRAYIDDKIRHELDVRIHEFIAEQHRQDAWRAKVADIAASKKAVASENQRINAELALLKDTRMRSEYYARNAQYDNMVRNLIPTLRDIASSNEAVASALRQCFEDMPRLAGILRRVTL